MESSEGYVAPIRWEYHGFRIDQTREDDWEGDGLFKDSHALDNPPEEEKKKGMADMDRLGREGWELVLSLPATLRGLLGETSISHEFGFKRPYKLCKDCGSKIVFTYASGGGFEHSSRHIQECEGREDGSFWYCHENTR